MTDYHQGLVLITNSSGEATIAFRGATGKILAGGSGKNGDIRVRDGDQQERIWLMGGAGDVIADNDLWVGPKLGPGKRSLVFDGSESSLTIWHKSSATNKTSRAFHFSGRTAGLQIGDKGNSGDLIVYDDKKREAFRVTARKAQVLIGSKGNRGRLIIADEGGVHRFHLDGKGYIEIRDEAGNQVLGFNTNSAGLVLGRQDKAGRIVLYGDSGSQRVDIGANGGDVILKDSAGQNRIRLDPDGANAWLGGNGADGDLVLFPAGGDNRTLDQATIHMDGNTGDIRLSGADCAELFDAADDGNIEPGTVLVMDELANMRPCTSDYDKRVAGVVSGAGGYRPGVILDYQRRKGVPVALTGKVWCNLDATANAVEVGDLLTTSKMPGHAMKATDPVRAFGTVLGKAMGCLSSGKGQIPVLVSLQ